MTSVHVAQGRIPAEMVIPLKWRPEDTETARVQEMTEYLRALAQTVTATTVVDGSDEEVFRAHRRAWERYARVVRPDPRVVGSPDPCCHLAQGRGGGLNGKVVGALTGIRSAEHELVLLADDDVRHSRETISRLVGYLDDADLVRPVNVYDAWPWQARWDGARSLLNHAVATDWPGTFALRRSTVLGLGGWCAHSLFENLELWRTVRARGGRVRSHPEVAVARRPPGVGQFWSQRVRHAYDDFAQPSRLLLELSILPLGVVLVRSRPAMVLAIAAASVLLAERGRRRLGTRCVPPSVPLWTPLWLVERGVCAWLAVGIRMRGGVLYHGQRIRLAAHPARQLVGTHPAAPTRRPARRALMEG